MRLNDATPADWDRVAKEHPAIDPNDSVTLKPYTDMAMEEAHKMILKESCTQDLDWGEDVINRPIHYNTGNIECIEAIEESMSSAGFKGYLKGNCMKYLWRYDYKGKRGEDLRKAQWYLNKLTEKIEEENT
jgi:hypothetical protein